ncbi:MAG TPA: tetratricopeptide repeat protein, partial [Ktedonobacteraceae bacterium]|nr:tetratricopeptide repeat protein [Ktedonobacteraceae bacterium]
TSATALLGFSQNTKPGINILQNWDQQVFLEQQLAVLWDAYHTGETAQTDYKLKILLKNYEIDLRHNHAAELLCISYQLQGSLYRDMMKYDDAHVFYQRAFEAAKELDDAELMSAALARRGVTLIQQNKATAAVEYLSEAHTIIRSHTLPCLTGYIFQALSEAYAITQQESESKQHIDAAQQVLRDRGQVPERSHCQANTTSVIAQMGVNEVHLHNYSAAITFIDQGMENYNPTFVRGRARLKAQQAEAYYGLGDIRACCQSATEAWLLARAASSNKTFARLRKLQRDLVISPQKKEPEVIDLNWVMTTL